MASLFEKIMQKFAEQETRRKQEKQEEQKRREQEQEEEQKRREQEKLEKEKRRLEKEQRRLEKEQRREQQRQEDKQHLLIMVANWGQQNKGKLEVELRLEMSPEKGDYDETDILVAEVKMSSRGRKLINPKHLNEYKVSSAKHKVIQ
ncbi:hypothetical protein WA026_019903 [Henosepilachna vigintioctopunctata]|uniref:Uncharacterized protein n=1 Tax=Henosepilachna vigintioctopunctata TaxID=420089 RepID=A0AAW1V9R7_9CUCU